MTSMVGTFSNSSYDGALDQWDTSNVVTLESTFGSSSFTGDISDWVSRLCIWIGQRKMLCLLKLSLFFVCKNCRMSGVSVDTGSSSPLWWDLSHNSFSHFCPLFLQVSLPWHTCKWFDGLVS